MNREKMIKIGVLVFEIEDFNNYLNFKDWEMYIKNNYLI